MSETFKVNSNNIDISKLDPKINIDLYDEYLEMNDNLDQTAVKIKFGQYYIWTIEDFYTNEQCDEIINKCEEIGFTSLDEIYDKSYRDSERILCFPDEKFIKDFNMRLSGDHFMDRLKDIKPYGFYNPKSEWHNIKNSHESNIVNDCFRINKYDENSEGFNWHRDSPYVKSIDTRSNYTIVVYLNDPVDEDDGAVEFYLPDNDIINMGETIKKEMKMHGDNYKTKKINIKKGMALVFDQRLIHRALPTKSQKYVIRTDLLTQSFDNDFNLYAKSSIFKDSFLNDIYMTTLKMFRHAQIMEFCGLDATKLYEKCVSLRLGFSKFAKIYDDENTHDEIDKKQIKQIRMKMKKHLKSLKPIKFDFDRKYDIVLEKIIGSKLIFSYKKHVSDIIEYTDISKICAMMTHNKDNVKDILSNEKTKYKISNHSHYGFSDDEPDLFGLDLEHTNEYSEEVNNTDSDDLDSDDSEEFDIQQVHDEMVEYNKLYGTKYKDYSNDYPYQASEKHPHAYLGMHQLLGENMEDWSLSDDDLEYINDNYYEKIELPVYEYIPEDFSGKIMKLRYDLITKYGETEHCGFSFCERNFDEDYDDKYVCEIIEDITYDDKYDNSEFTITNVKNDENYFTCDVICEYVGLSFNHASCQCYTYYKHTTENLKGYALIRENINVIIDKNTNKVMCEYIPILLI